MLHQHRSHLLSTCTTVMQHLEEIRQVIALGKSPAGARLTPLPEPVRQRLLDSLDSIQCGLNEMVHFFAPDEGRASEEPAGLSATLMWTSILLRTVEELIGDLSPARMGRRYGALGREDADQLQNKVDSTIAAVRRAMQLADAADG